MNSMVYLLAIVIVVALVAYFIFLASSTGNAAKQTTIVTSIPPAPNTTTVSPSNPGTSDGSSNASYAPYGWVSAVGYPTPVGDAQCVIVHSRIYCMGGVIAANSTRLFYTSDTYSAAVTSNGISGIWRESIPLQIIPSSCTTYSTSIFCITGRLLPFYNSTTDNVTNQTYVASTTQTGLGPWVATTTYPVNATTNGCVTSGFIIYCVGGMASNKTFISRSYYATVSSNGIGQWKETAALPVAANPQCFVYSLTIYCLGSYANSNGTMQNFNYYASVTGSGISSWSSTAPAPNPPGNYSCSYYKPFIYCIGGGNNYTSLSNVYYTGLSIGGVNGWHLSTVLYPLTVTNSTTCTSFNDTRFCIGGQTENLSYLNSVYYTTSHV